MEDLKALFWTNDKIEECRKLFDRGDPIYRIAHHFRKSKESIKSVIQKHALNRKSTKNLLAPPPEDFVDVWSKVKSANGIVSHYNVSEATAVRWISKSGVRRDHVLRTVPKCFYENGPKMSREELIRHYEINWRRLMQWLDATGVETKGKEPGYKRSSSHSPRGRPRANASSGGIRISTASFTAPVTQSDTASQAAHYLRRFYSNVFRADIRLFEAYRDTWGEKRGLPDKGRYHYFVSGAGVLDLDQVVALAEKHGYKKEFI